MGVWKNMWSNMISCFCIKKRKNSEENEVYEKKKSVENLLVQETVSFQQKNADYDKERLLIKKINQEQDILYFRLLQEELKIVLDEYNGEIDEEQEVKQEKNPEANLVYNISNLILLIFFVFELLALVLHFYNII